MRIALAIARGIVRAGVAYEARVRTVANVGEKLDLAAAVSRRQPWPLGGRIMLALGLAVVAWALPVGAFFLLR